MSDAAPGPDPQPEPAGPQHVGIRELRHDFRAYINRAKAGERFVVTDRGQPVAELVPHVRSASVLDRLIRAGKAIPPRHRTGTLPDPLPMQPGQSPLSEVLQDMREDRM